MSIELSGISTESYSESPSVSPDTVPLVSVIILNYQGRLFIERCLKSVLASEYPRIEVIVVDNGSTDDSMDIARNFGSRITCIENGKNLGFSAGCNVGIRKCHGEIVVLLNVDTCVRKRWLEALVQPFLEDPRVGLTGSKMLFLDGKTIQHAGGEVLPNGLCQHTGYGKKDERQHDEPREVDYLSGASLAIRRDVLDEIGLLDEGYFFYYDDVDLASSMKQRGFKVLYRPDSVLLHYETFGLKKKSFDYYFRFHRGRLRYIFKHFGIRYYFSAFMRAEIDWWRTGAGFQQGRPLLCSYAVMLPKAPWLWLRGFFLRRKLRRLRRKMEEAD